MAYQAKDLIRMAAMILVVPMLVAGVPLQARKHVLAHQYLELLSDRGTETTGTISATYLHGGRSPLPRLEITSRFKAADGRLYLSIARYPASDAPRLQVGTSVPVVYQTDRPANSAPSLEHARDRLQEDAMFLALMTVALLALLWLYWSDYRAVAQWLWDRVRGGLPARP